MYLLFLAPLSSILTNLIAVSGVLSRALLRWVPLLGVETVFTKIGWPNGSSMLTLIGIGTTVFLFRRGGPRGGFLELRDAPNRVYCEFLWVPERARITGFMIWVSGFISRAGIELCLVTETRSFLTERSASGTTCPTWGSSASLESEISSYSGADWGKPTEIDLAMQARSLSCSVTPS